MSAPTTGTAIGAFAAIAGAARRHRYRPAVTGILTGLVQLDCDALSGCVGCPTYGDHRDGRHESTSIHWHSHSSCSGSSIQRRSNPAIATSICQTALRVLMKEQSCCPLCRPTVAVRQQAKPGRTTCDRSRRDRAGIDALASKSGKGRCCNEGPLWPQPLASGKASLFSPHRQEGRWASYGVTWKTIGFSSGQWGRNSWPVAKPNAAKRER